MFLETQAANAVMDALGHQTRRDILTLLRSGPMPVGAIAAQLPISRPAVSKHLRTLQRAGLVEYAPKGASNIFRLRYSGFQMARVYLESFWDEALANFQRAVDEQTKGNS